MIATKTSDYWYRQEGDQAAKSVFSYLKDLEQYQAYRTAENYKFMRLYGNSGLDHLRNYSSARAQEPSSIAHRVTMNVVQSMIDTVVSKIAKNKPRPMFLTTAGDFTQQRKAEKLTQFIEGQFDACDFYAKSSIAFMDSCIFGTGVLKIFKEDGEVKVERIFIDEIKIDDRESIYGLPRQMHQEKFIHIDVLKEMFPDHATFIELAANPMAADYSSQAAGESPDMIRVVESWRLPSSKTAEDGKHTISIYNRALFEEEYTKTYFPFIFWRWGLRPMGFFGQGLAEQLQGIQLEINKILRTIQVSMHLVSVPKIFVDAASKIVDSHLDNRIGSIIKYAGTPPTPGQLGTIPPELFAHLDRLYQRSYEIAGISQLSATSKKPDGLDSGKALREYNDLETERFMSVSQRYEKAFLDAVPIMIDLAKEIDAEMRENGDGAYKVKVKGKKFLKTIKWKQVDIDEDQYTTALFPTSALSRSPAGRQAELRELMNDGFVSKEDAMKLLDFPDLKGFYNFETAAGEDIDMVLEAIMEDGDYMTPEPYQNLEYGINKMQKAYLLFRSQKAPEEKLELIRRWIEDAYALMNRALVQGQRQQMEAASQLQQMAEMDAAQNAPAPEMGLQEPPPQEMVEAVPRTGQAAPQ